MAEFNCTNTVPNPRDLAKPKPNQLSFKSRNTKPIKPNCANVKFLRCSLVRNSLQIPYQAL